jgi:hypothetical protein
VATLGRMLRGFETHATVIPCFSCRKRSSPITWLAGNEDRAGWVRHSWVVACVEAPERIDNPARYVSTKMASGAPATAPDPA